MREYTPSPITVPVHPETLKIRKERDSARARARIYECKQHILSLDKEVERGENTAERAKISKDVLLAEIKFWQERMES